MEWPMSSSSSHDGILKLLNADNLKNIIDANLAATATSSSGACGMFNCLTQNVMGTVNLSIGSRVINLGVEGSSTSAESKVNKNGDSDVIQEKLSVLHALWDRTFMPKSLRQSFSNAALVLNQTECLKKLQGEKERLKIVVSTMEKQKTLWTGIGAFYIAWKKNAAIHNKFSVEFRTNVELILQVERLVLEGAKKRGEREIHGVRLSQFFGHFWDEACFDKEDFEPASCPDAEKHNGRRSMKTNSGERLENEVFCLYDEVKTEWYNTNLPNSLRPKALLLQETNITEEYKVALQREVKRLKDINSSMEESHPQFWLKLCINFEAWKGLSSMQKGSKEYCKAVTRIIRRDQVITQLASQANVKVLHGKKVQALLDIYWLEAGLQKSNFEPLQHTKKPETDVPKRVQAQKENDSSPTMSVRRSVRIAACKDSKTFVSSGGKSLPLSTQDAERMSGKQGKAKRTPSNSYQCFMCKDVFMIKDSLEAHISMHLGVFPFKCLHCSDVFLSSGMLSFHLQQQHI